MPRKTDIIKVARRMPDGRLGIVEKHMTTNKKLTREEQLAQATAMMHRRLFDPNASIQNLADEFGLCKETVTSRLQQARKDGVPAQAREIFIQEMLPLSMAVLLEVLRGEDKKLAAQVALKVTDGLKAMELNPDQPAAEEGDTLEIFRERIKVVRQTQPSSVQADGQEARGDTIEVSAIPVPGPERAVTVSKEDPTPPGTPGSEGSLETVRAGWDTKTG